VRSVDAHRVMIHAGWMRNTDDIPTLGGICRRSKSTTDRPTLREMSGTPCCAPPPAPFHPPPTRKRALQLAEQFLSGAEGQREVGRDGCEEMARRIIADAEEREALAEASIP